MKAEEIAGYIAELYGKECELNDLQKERIENTFEKYDLEDIKHAVNEYWTYKNSKTKPTVAQILALLDAHGTEKLPDTADGQGTLKGDYAVQRMASDIETGVCRNNLYVYKDAERLILEDWLMQEIPASIWAKLDYSARIKQAEDKGLLARFDEALSICAQKRFGRAFEFTSKEDNKTLSADKAVKSLASHWRV